MSGDLVAPQDMTMPRASADDVSVALGALRSMDARTAAAAWPTAHVDLAQAGLYSWWCDESGSQALASGIGLPLEPGLIYAGQTGATAWPSGRRRTTTLAQRIGGNHLKGTIHGSTFRRTLAACLGPTLGLRFSDPKRMATGDETRLSAWMRSHLSVALHPVCDRDSLGDLEDRVLADLDPPLNLEGMPPTELRTRVRELRGGIGRSSGGGAP